MRVREIRELTVPELKQKITDKMEELANLKFQLALHQLDNTAKIRQARRDLARMKTILREMDSKATSGATVAAGAAEKAG